MSQSRRLESSAFSSCWAPVPMPRGSLLISGSKVRVLDGPPMKSATSGSPEWPIVLVPDFGSKFGTNEFRNPVEEVCPPPTLVRDPPCVVAGRRRRVGVPELRAHVRDGRVGGQEQARVGVAQVVEPELRECRRPGGALEDLPDSRLVHWLVTRSASPAVALALADPRSPGRAWPGTRPASLRPPSCLTPASTARYQAVSGSGRGDDSRYTKWRAAGSEPSARPEQPTFTM